jgi:peptide-methionine (S)-S-oxide reductase
MRRFKGIGSAVLVVCAAIAAMAFGAGRFGASPGTAAGKVGTHPGGIGLMKGPLKPAAGDELAAFSAGCFWGVEDAFRQVPGVVATAVGYTGGTVPNPTYEQVCTHTTGHAESVLVEFDPKRISYPKLLSWFWKIHDPTQVDRQGPDIGNSYRSAIWCFSDEQLRQARASESEQAKELKAPIATQISRAKPFYLAEDYHQQYAERTGDHSCPVRYPGG